MNTTELTGIKNPNIIISFIIDMSEANIPLARRLFSNDEIIIERSNIIHHLGRAFLKIRIAIMSQFDKKSLSYQALKNHWRLFQKDRRRLSCKSFHSKTFCHHLSPHEVIEK